MYDTDLIKAKNPAKYRKEQSQLGTTYRVVVEKDRKEKADSILRSYEISKERPPWGSNSVGDAQSSGGGGDIVSNQQCF